jgi:hypothetical protein
MHDCAGFWITPRALLQCVLHVKCQAFADSLADREEFYGTLQAAKLDVTSPLILPSGPDDLPLMPNADKITPVSGLRKPRRRSGHGRIGPVLLLTSLDTLAENSARYFSLVTGRPATSHASSPPRYHETFGYPRATSSSARLRASQKPAFQEKVITRRVRSPRSNRSTRTLRA